jgi:hypothetical protein
MTLRYEEGVDLSNVRKSDVTVYVGEQLGPAQRITVRSVSAVDGDRSLELTLGGSTALGPNQQIVAEYDGVSMPERPGQYAVSITLNSTATERGILEVTGKASVIASDFEKTGEGWRIMGDAQGNSTFPNHEQSGGNPGRCLSAVDTVEGGTWYWVAPRQFVGDKSAYHDGELRFDIYQNNRSSQFNARDVILSGTSTDLVYNFGDVDSHPQTDWTSYTVPLQATSSWTVESLEGTTATADHFETVLGDLQSLAIRGEYVTGSDTGYLDNPAIVPANRLDGEPEATIQTPDSN